MNGWTYLINNVLCGGYFKNEEEAFKKAIQSARNSNIKIQTLEIKEGDIF